LRQDQRPPRPRRLPAISLPVQYLVPVALVLVAAHLAFRAWAIWSSWFLLDDFNLLSQGQVSSPDWQYLAEPYNGHLMPGGRLVSWVVAQNGYVNWSLAAVIMLAIQALASLSALWMLLVLFGRRWGILVPLVLYTTSALSVPSFIWWAASLNQTPIQVAFFCAVGSWVHYLRSRSVVWLVATVLAVAFGLFFWVKALLVFPVLGFLALAYFAEGDALARLSAVLRRYWLGCAAGGVLVAAYLYVYLGSASDQSREFSLELVGGLADTMIGSAFSTGVLGGPWRWDNFAPPTAYADPPRWAEHAAWVVIALVIAYLWLRRTNTLRAWVLVVGYLMALLALLVGSRAPLFGAGIGMELRYVADAILVVTLAVGLATMPVMGAVQSSLLRDEPLLSRAVPTWVVASLVGAVAIGGLYSSAAYALIWHNDNPGKSYLLTLQSDLDRRPPTDLAAQVVPEDVFSSLAAPANNTAFLAPLLSGRARFVETSAALATVGPDGTLRQTLIESGTVSRKGPVDGCGWQVRSQGRSIPLKGRAFDYVWWLRIGYLASADSPVVVEAGDTTHETMVMAGLHNLYVRVEGTFDRVEIDGLDPGVTMCVDVVQVGEPVPGGPLR
jgi:hypothetical protein